MMQPAYEHSIPVAYFPELKSNKQKRKVLGSAYSLSRWTRDNFYPLLFKVATFGLFILFFLYKCLIGLLGAMLLAQHQVNLFIQTNLKSKLSGRKKVVVVGGGYAGTHAAKSLEREFDVTLIDTKDYYEFTPSRLRSLIEPSHTHRIQIKYESILSKAAIVVDKVDHVTKEGVFVDGEHYPYDYLIVSTGSRYVEPLFPPFEGAPISDYHAKVISARVPNLDSYHSLLTRSKRILVIGGGTVGVELAGEIIDRFEDKEVTLIHSQGALMNRSPERASSYTENFFKKTNVTVIVGERITEQTGIFFRTNKGTIVEADLAFMCTGNVPNSELLKNNFPSYVNKYGLVKVNDFLQMEGYSNIFVAGDLTDIPDEEEKLCQTAYDEIKVVLNNIRNLEYGRSLKKYVPSACPMLISLGKYDGILTYKKWTFTGFIPAVMKEFVEWKEMIWYWDWSHFSMSYRKQIIYRGDFGSTLIV